MENCIFCKIGRKEIPSKTVFEDDKFIAFLDINPVREGHTLLVPKDHYRWFTDLPNDLYDELFRAAKTLALKLKDDYHADYVRLGIVGKDVAHTHIHLVPQKMEEEGGPRI
ncbi:MAG TPA: HIT domain-containing protein [Parcubacteria group bacterium]|nr:HIT domain-containing protein [Parcubacteria group bacterium]